MRLQKLTCGNIKMATKDWKKQKLDKKDIDPKIKSVDAFRNTKDFNYIHVISFKYKPGYEFRTLLLSQHRQFKTKSQALAYAKAYMRKH